jgi:hypothetical protein
MSAQLLVATVIRNTSLSIIDPVYARALFLSPFTSIRTLIHKYLCFFKPQHSSPPSALLQLQECLSSACAERIKCLLKVFPSEAIIQSQSIPEAPRQTVSLFWTSRTRLKHQHYFVHPVVQIPTDPSSCGRKPDYALRP